MKELNVLGFDMYLNGDINFLRAAKIKKHINKKYDVAYLALEDGQSVRVKGLFKPINIEEGYLTEMMKNIELEIRNFMKQMDLEPVFVGTLFNNSLEDIVRSRIIFNDEILEDIERDIFYNGI